jgi:hypothetical protein
LHEFIIDEENGHEHDLDLLIISHLINDVFYTLREVGVELKVVIYGMLALHQMYKDFILIMYLGIRRLLMHVDKMWALCGHSSQSDI